jgi:methionine-rich copper-binding protein CopC
MRRILVLVAGALAISAAPSAWAHAFLDHASPAVGSSVPASPPVVTLWFTQDLEPAFSGVSVTDEAGQRAISAKPRSRKAVRTSSRSG